MMVPVVGLEPTLLSEQDFESSASTISPHRRVLLSEGPLFCRAFEGLQGFWWAKNFLEQNGLAQPVRGLQKMLNAGNGWIRTAARVETAADACA